MDNGAPHANGNGDKRRLQDIVENLWLKLAARLLMIFALPTLLAVTGWTATHVYEAWGRMEQTMTKFETRIQIDELSSANDRINTTRLFDDAQKRIDILSGRVSDGRYTAPDAERDFKFRDLRLDGLDHRVGAIEDKANGRRAPPQ